MFNVLTGMGEKGEDIRAEKLAVERKNDTITRIR